MYCDIAQHDSLFAYVVSVVAKVVSYGLAAKEAMFLSTSEPPVHGGLVKQSFHITLLESGGNRGMALSARA